MMNARRKKFVCAGFLAAFLAGGFAVLPVSAAQMPGLGAESAAQDGTAQNSTGTAVPDGAAQNSTESAAANGEQPNGAENTAVKDGWYHEGEKTYYYSSGSVLAGRQEIEGQTYYFSPETGEMQTGWQEMEGQTYYFSPETGEMQTGWQEIKDQTYYFSPETGVMKTGWLSKDGEKYYFSDADGKMLAGRQEIEDEAYYFDEDGVLQTSKWVKAGSKTYYCKKSGVLQTGWLSSSGRKYYFSKTNNNMLTGWQKIGGYKYYFAASGADKGAMQKNCIAGTKKAGYYYVDGSGIQVTSSEIKQAVNFVRAHTNEGWPKSEKLQACFEALWKSCTYQRFYETPTAQSMSGYADYMFKNKKGNCFRYAASFACIAKVLGYESRVYTGSISSARGGMTPHGWTEVKISGTWYMCDANMQRNHPNINSYMRTDGNYHYRHTRSKAYTLTVKKGRVSWK